MLDLAVRQCLLELLDTFARDLRFAEPQLSELTQRLQVSQAGSGYLVVAIPFPRLSLSRTPLRGRTARPRRLTSEGSSALWATLGKARDMTATVGARV